LYLQLLFSPFGDSLLLDFSKALIKGEKIGQDEYTDYLSISFSGVDAINHFFGVSSLENEDTVLQLDKTLADLFRFIDDQVGLDQTLIVLSADHGMAEMPEYMTELGLKVGRLYSEDVVSIANTLGKDLFSIDDMVKFFYRPYLYLDENKIRAADLDIAVVEKRLAAALTDVEGIALAAPRDGLPMIQAPAILKQIQNNYHPSRSGDIYIAQEPYWFMFEKGPAVAMHGSPWNYDTHVPVIFSGPGITAQTIARLIHPVDVAPTLSAYLGMSPPAASSGTGLHEILDQPGSP
jgi:predicted AlkP superfamily pyrophosphatase or phosphodiesterase